MTDDPGDSRDTPGASPPRRDRTLFYVALAFAAFWALTVTWFNPLRPRGGPGLSGTGLIEPADYGWRPLDLDGRPVDFARYKGKAVFLNLWATWCPPCVGEMPSIARLAADPKLKDVAFVCVSTDETADAVTRFLKGKTWPMTFLRATEVPPVFATEGIPATFVIAPDGRIAASQIGAADWDDPKVVALLEQLAREAPGAK